MGRDAAQISREIEQTRAELATTLVAIRSTDVKAKVDDARTLAITKAKAKAQELQPMLKARAQAKADEVKATAIARGREKVHELKPVALARVQELKPVALARVQELKPLAIARAKDKVAEVTPVLADTAKAKVEEVKPIAIARAQVAVDALKSKARAVATAKLEDTRGAAASGASALGSRALEAVSSKRNAGTAGGALAAGLALVVARRRFQKRSQTRLQRLAAQAEAVNTDALERAAKRVRGKAAKGIQHGTDALQHGADAPKRLRKRMRRR